MEHYSTTGEDFAWFRVVCEPMAHDKHASQPISVTAFVHVFKYKLKAMPNRSLPCTKKSDLIRPGIGCAVCMGVAGSVCNFQHLILHTTFPNFTLGSLLASYFCNQPTAIPLHVVFFVLILHRSYSPRTTL